MDEKSGRFDPGMYRGSLPNATFCSGKNPHQPKLDLAKYLPKDNFGLIVSLLQCSLCDFCANSFITAVFWPDYVITAVFLPKNCSNEIISLKKHKPNIMHGLALMVVMSLSG